LLEVAEEVLKLGGDPAVAADVADAAAIFAAADRIAGDLGPIDIWINFHQHNLLDMSEAMTMKCAAARRRAVASIYE
jgi:NAD(P)-dependent dehydrogenase (short-subunit alcohol dehydrogenase family)